MMYFLSVRGLAGNNNGIYMSTRPNKSTPWTTPVSVMELATSSTHRDVEVSANGNEIIFTRFNSVTSRIEVMVARRTKPTDPFNAPVILTELTNVGTSLGVYSMTLSQTGPRRCSPRVSRRQPEARRSCPRA
jgi:hypothetical protein